MYGHGSPLSIPSKGRTHLRFLVAICLLLAATSARAEISVRLQMAWGGQPAQLWRGAVRVTSGHFDDLRLLGLDSDQPGAFVLQEDRILVEPRHASAYSGLEVNVTATSADEHLELLLHNGLQSEDDQVVRIPLRELIENGHAADLGDQHKLRIARAAGDALRVSFDRPSLVYAPGQQLEFDLQPFGVRVKPYENTRGRLRLRKAKQTTDFWNQDNVLWSGQLTYEADGEGTFGAQSVAVPVPEAEGVYELSIELLHGPLSVRREIAQRIIQFVVINPAQPPRFSELPTSNVTEFNPALPRWYDQLPQWPLLPRGKKGPWSSAPTEVTKHDGAAWTQLNKGQWVAYSLPVEHVDVPHVLEIDLPSGAVQDLGICIMQEGAAASLPPLSLGSGVQLGDPDLMEFALDAKTEPSRHRLVFWPKSATPLLVLCNQTPNQSAEFGAIRIRSYPQGLPAQPARDGNTRKRLALITQPMLLKQTFQTAEAFDARNFSFEDWETFYQATIRLTEYLRFAGFDGAMVAAATEGSALFPSNQLRPTPRYDRGVYANTGQDPMRKDVLEMMFRIFGREGLILIPGFDFSAPLPELESKLASGAQEVGGIELVDLSGRRPTDGRRLPYYNLLDDRVQSAILEVLREFHLRYGHHPSWQGLQLLVGDGSPLRLPDLEWGSDLRTLRRFAGADEDTSAEEQIRELREALAASELNSPRVEDWLAWRSEQISQFYREAADLISEERSTRRLYLGLPPTRRDRAGTDTTLMQQGLDAKALSAIANISLTWPREVASWSQLSAAPAPLASGESKPRPKLTGFTGSQILYRPQQLPLPGFSSRQTRLGTSELPAREEGIPEVRAVLPRGHADARQPLAHQLALHDDRVVLEGGEHLPLGQEDATREYFTVYRQIPDRPFRTLKLDTAGPVVVRQSSTDEETFVYFVNDSPWSATLLFEWTSATDRDPEPIGSAAWKVSRQDGHATGHARLEPYGLFACRFAASDVEMTRCQTYLPSGIAKRLLDHYDAVRLRAEELKKGASRETGEPRLTPAQHTELNRILTVAYQQQRNNDLAGWYRTLSSYWPRYLLRHVAPPAPRPESPRVAKIPAESTKPTIKGWNRFRRLIPTLRF